jgi:protein TonB
MQSKKSTKSNLENFSRLFMLLGLVLALLLTYVAMEHKTLEDPNDQIVSYTSNMLNEEEVIPETEQKPEDIKPEEQKVAPPPVLEEIEVVEDNEEIEETVIESTETNEKEKIVIEEIEEVEITEEVVEDVPFSIIEDVPVYPGCTGSKAELKDCLSKNVQKFVSNKFNVDLAQDLGLTPGKKRIFVMFKIDKNGNITSIQARAPHKRLEAEAIRVVGLLPQMKPGKQRGRPVGVKYSLPISFIVQE